ncbi:hypothetical protein MATL_G00040940 [Megalops atlanticus]|uniref:non-specific serine/threonine protein kinase n=1 Tax=Megalops atlanticus TaxID=7932 RepID=A0A9D3QE89_MEGAT|nr:hypothetical protein MATL_G00040940 [Megalops atlanticus]
MRNLTSIHRVNKSLQEFITMGNEQSLLKQHGYTLVEEVGQTYFMRTARVKDDKTKKQYIAKEIRINNVPRNLQEDILAEVDILTNMRHPNILKCKETLKDRDTLYVVMEYCEGGELSQKITRQRETGEQFSEDQVLDWFVQICMALQYLHEHSILHKDLKPQNIFFTKAGVIRLDTSGIPRGLDSTLPTSELQLQHYTPLEILRGNPHNEKSDVWSLGCVLYELCMLEPAFSAFSENDLIARLQRDLLSMTYCGNHSFYDSLLKSLGQLLKNSSKK